MSPRSLMLGGGVFLLLAAYLIFCFAKVRDGLRVAAWDASYELRAGNEVGGELPFLGDVWDARVCTRRAHVESCAPPSADAPVRQSLVERVEASGFVHLQATVRSDSDRQGGPARIVSFSAGPSRRNATLAQSGRALVFRVRTRLSGPNGDRPEFVLPDAVEVGIETGVGALFRDGAVALWAESEADRRRAEFRFGAFDSWLIVQYPGLQVTPSRLFRARVAGTINCFMPLGWGLAVLLRSRLGHRRQSEGPGP